jgi:hypothetical protein
MILISVVAEVGTGCASLATATSSCKQPFAAAVTVVVIVSHSVAISATLVAIAVVIVIILAITLFLSTNPVVGILGFLAAYEFIRRSSRTTGVYGIETFSPTEQKKQEVMTAMNPAPVFGSEFITTFAFGE